MIGIVIVKFYSALHLVFSNMASLTEKIGFSAFVMIGAIIFKHLMISQRELSFLIFLRHQVILLEFDCVKSIY